MQVKRYNIKKGRKYTDKQTGEEKTYWDQIGTITEFCKEDGSVSKIINIPAIGLDGSIFPIEPKQQQGTGYQAPATTQQPAIQRPTQTPATQEINISEIPF